MVVALVAAWAVALVWLLGRRRPGSGPGSGPGREVENVDQQQAAEAAERGEVVVYWRPGCSYCARLERTLGDLRDRAVFVNIWEDADAAAFVRSVNDGNEVVPTVVMNGIPVTNPKPAVVVDAIRAHD